MKIGIVTNLYPPYARGGAEVVITRIVTELLLLGHDVFVITTRPYGGITTLFPKLEDESSERVYRFYPFNFYHSLNDFRFPKWFRLFWHLVDMVSPFSARGVRRILQEEQPDVVITHNLKGIGLPISRAIRSAGFFHLHHVHDVQLGVPSGLILAGHEQRLALVRVGQRWYSAICRAIIGSPNIVLMPSRFLAAFYRERGFFPKSEVVVMPNPAPNIKPLERGQRVAGPLRLLFVGQLVEHKGIRFLMDTLKSLDRPFELSIAGDGQLHSWVQETARSDKRLIYVGYSSIDRLQQLFRMADVLVVPSLCYENSPTVIYEALQSGLSVVAADIGGVAELIKEGENGFLFKPGDPDALLVALRQADSGKETLYASAGAIQATVAEHAMHNYIHTLMLYLSQYGGRNKSS